MHPFKWMLILAFSLTLSVSAQQSYIQPNVGIGVSSISPNHNFIGANLRPLPVWSAGIQVGKQYKHLRIGVGIAAFTTGRRSTNETGFNPQTNTPDTFTTNMVSRHIGIPLSLGISFPASSRLSIEPEIVLSPCYNLGARYSGKSTSQGRFTPISRKAYDWFILYSWVNFNFIYQLNPNIKIVAGPSFTHVVNYVWPVGYLNSDAVISQYAVTARAGVLLSL